MHALRVERVDDEQWRVTIDERPLSPTFVSEREARNAVAAEVVRLDASCSPCFGAPVPA